MYVNYRYILTCWSIVRLLEFLVMLCLVVLLGLHWGFMPGNIGGSVSAGGGGVLISGLLLLWDMF
jgi:hypothetical protein